MGFRYLLSHPDSVTEKGELTLFSHIDEGQLLTLMTGSVDGLVQRAWVVAQNAIDLLPEGVNARRTYDLLWWLHVNHW